MRAFGFVQILMPDVVSGLRFAETGFFWAVFGSGRKQRDGIGCALVDGDVDVRFGDGDGSG